MHALDIEEYRLTIEQFAVSALIDDGLLSSLDIKLHMQYRLEQMARQLTATMRLPADVLRRDDVIAEWPDGLWQTVRKALRLKYRKQQVRMTEMLLFPGIKVPPGMKDWRVHVATRPCLLDYKAASWEDFT